MITYHNGRFRGEFDSSTAVKFWHILRWKILETPLRPKTNHKIFPLEIVDHSDRLATTDDFICWLSHASFLLQLGGKRILIDPVFGNLPFIKRQIPLPYTPETLGKIDYLLISHAHYDHLDAASVKTIAQQCPRSILPLKMGTLINKIAPKLPVVELGWHQTFESDGLSITLVPARHWSRRSAFDTNRSLWGGFVLSYGGKTIYFAGDTAFGPHFEQIGKLFDIDIALLPIGAYKPEYIMKHNHLDPQEAFDAFEKLGAKMMIPMHYGTFKLSDEPFDEPLKWMKNIAAKNSKTIIFVKPGEVLLT